MEEEVQEGTKREGRIWMAFERFRSRSSLLFRMFDAL